MKALIPISQAKVKYIQKLTQKKFRIQEKKFLAEGLKLVEEAVASDWRVEQVLVTREAAQKEGFNKLQRTLEERDIALVTVSEKDIRKISDTVTSQGVVAVVQKKDFALNGVWATNATQSLIVVLDDISDPGNLGTIVRTCDWFGVDALLLSENTVELYNPKVVRSTMGSIFHLPVIADLDIAKVLQDAKRNGYRLYVTALEGGKAIDALDIEKKSLLIFGSEAHGVAADVKRMANELITLPRYGKAESLNVAVACGVVLAEVVNRQRK